MDDKFISFFELMRLMTQDYFLSVDKLERSSLVKCFYCDTDNNAKLEFCQSCNGPLEDGYGLVGMCYGKRLFLDKTITDRNLPVNELLGLYWKVKESDYVRT